MSPENLPGDPQLSSAESAAALARTVVQTAATLLPIATAGLYGSGAQGRLRGDSDLDIGLLLSQPVSPLDLAAVAAELEGLANRPVQLVDLATASPILGHQVVAHGVLLLDRQPRRRHEWLMRTMSDYFDLKMTRKSGEEALRQRLTHAR